MIEFRLRWALLVIAAAYSIALLVPPLMPSVQTTDALPEPVAIADMTADLDTANLPDGPDPAVMAALHEQARATLRELQMASAQPQ